MYSCLLKKLVPFALTFVIGSTIGGLFNSHGPRATSTFGVVGPSYRFERRYSCRMHARDLVAETKPLVILFKPDAVLPHEFHENAWKVDPIFVNVTFGADGKVQKVERVDRSFINYKTDDLVNISDTVEKAAEKAAQQIQFEPEMINSMPVSVTKEVEIHFISY